MIIILRSGATEQNLDELCNRIKDIGYDVHVSRGVETTLVGCIGALEEDKENVIQQFTTLPYVDRVVPISKPYKIVSLDFQPENTVVEVNGVKIGGEQIVIMAGPCTVESQKQLFDTADFVKAQGATVLRGGAFKPSTSPYSFQGMGEDGLKLLAEARDRTGLPIITECLDTRDVDLVARYADILQVGTRNMANFALLKEIGLTKKPVMLKRGWASTIEEWMQAAEYIAARGNRDIMLCERGIRTYEQFTRNTFDVSAIPACKSITHLPIIADPSQGTGRWNLVAPVSYASVAAGADGLIIEVHPHPEQALKDGAQSLKPQKFTELMQRVRLVAEAVGRHV